MLKVELWTECNYNGVQKVREFVEIPIGLRDSICPKCHSRNLCGAVITETADSQDPNILCLDCGYWWD